MQASFRMKRAYSCLKIVESQIDILVEHQIASLSQHLVRGLTSTEDSVDKIIKWRNIGHLIGLGAYLGLRSNILGHTHLRNKTLEEND